MIGFSLLVHFHIEHAVETLRMAFKLRRPFLSPTPSLEGMAVDR